MKRKLLRGFTLVELIICMALMAVLMAMIGTMFKPISTLVSETSTYTKARYTMDEMSTILNDNTKFATEICVIRNAGSMTAADAILEARNSASHRFGGTNPADPKYVPDEKIYTISILNVATTSTLANSTDTYASKMLMHNDATRFYTGRIFKSACLDGVAANRKEWLVGGEAFYGDIGYFVNIEEDPTTHTINSNPLRFDTYQLESKFTEEQYSPSGQQYVFNSNLCGQSLDYILNIDVGGKDLVKNYSQTEISFINNPPGFTTIRYPSGANIYIVYTLPE